jgi:hypothetical protein
MMPGNTGAISRVSSPPHKGEGSKLRHVFVGNIGNKVMLEPLVRTEPEMAAVRAEIDAVRICLSEFFARYGCLL